MNVHISVKQAGKRKAYITKQELHLADTPGTLRQLISLIVQYTVQEYNSKAVEPSLLHYLSPETIQEQAQTGKVGFKDRKNAGQADLEEAIETALLAFEDGMYRVFIGDDEVENLDEPLTLREGDLLTFIRFTMLAGRLW